MSGLDIFSLIVLLVLAATILGVFVFLGLLPGKVARQRNHPQVAAITIGVWVALIAGGILWPLVLVWAYMQPSSAGSTAMGSENENLTKRLQELEQRLAVLEAQDANEGGAA